MIKKTKAFLHFKKYQKQSREYLSGLQNNKLRCLIEHAYYTTPFYREWMDRNNVKPGDIRRASDLINIPPIPKSELQGRYNDFISDRYDPGDCHLRSTSGSSGKVLRVVWDKENFWSRAMLFYRALSMIGYSPFKKIVYFLPGPEDTGFTFGLFRNMHISLDNSMDRIRDILRSYKPEIISIYPSYAVSLAHVLSKRDIEKIGLEAISLNSEMSLSHEKSMIKEIYKCPVFEEYSCTEVGMIAAMCKKQNRHIFMDNVIVEILDKNGDPAPPGVRGEVVLTALNSYAMPFIRYRINDYSYLAEGECECGNNFPILGPIEGRKDDSFKMVDGTMVPAWKIYEVVERPLERYGTGRLLLKDFYLVQRAGNMAEFFYVKGPDFEERYIDDLNQNVLELFGHGFDFKAIETVNIERVKSVKRKYVHTELGQGHCRKLPLDRADPARI